VRKFDQSLPMALLRAREIAMGYFRPLLNARVTEQQWRVIRVLGVRRAQFHELSRIVDPAAELTGILTRLELSLVSANGRRPTSGACQKRRPQGCAGSRR
jgi:hypothetical protein